MNRHLGRYTPTVASAGHSTRADSQTVPGGLWGGGTAVPILQRRLGEGTDGTEQSWPRWESHCFDLATPPGPTPGQDHGQQPVNGLREWLGTNYKRHRQHSQEEPQVTGCWSLVGADLYHPGQHGGLDPVRLGAIAVAQIFPQG